MELAQVRRHHPGVVIQPILLALAVSWAATAHAQDPRPVEPPAAPGAASTEAPPPLPFRYVGRLVQNGRAEILVMRGDALYSLHSGARVGDYRVDAVTASGVRFTYLPLNRQQELDLPGVY